MDENFTLCTNLACNSSDVSDLEVEGSVWAGRNITANYFIGDGSSLTGINSDRIISPDTNKTLILSDTNLIYQDGTQNRLVINSDNSYLKSPSGDDYVKALDTSVGFVYGGSNRLHITNSASKLMSDNQENFFRAKDVSILIQQGNKDRLWMDNIETDLYSPSKAGRINIRNTQVRIEIGGIDRLLLNDSESKLLSMDGNQSLLVNNSGAYYNDVEIGTGGSGDSDKITSPNELKNLTLTNSDLVYYDGTRDRIDVTAVHSKFYSPDGDYTLLDDSQ